MVKEGYVNSVNGQKVAVQAQTICLHGDGEKQYNLRKEYTEHLNKMAFLFVHRNKKMREVLELVKLIGILLVAVGFLFRLNTLFSRYGCRYCYWYGFRIKLL